MAKSAAAGIIEKISDITLFLNPSEQSYARFGKGTAPDKAKWSSTGESDLILISDDHGMTGVELRSPDASSNPYIVYALLIHAGLYGIENKLSLPDEMDEEVVMLPQTRRSAVSFASKSDFVREILPEALTSKYLQGQQ